MLLGKRNQVVFEGLIERPDEGDVVVRSWFWDGQTMEDLGVLPGTTFTRARDVNEAGQIVGYCSGPQGSRPFIWENGVIRNLNDLLCDAADVYMYIASAINDDGQIAGEGSIQLTGVGLLLTPVPDEQVADLDDDGVVGINDLIILLGAWGPCVACPEDIDGDGLVGPSDLKILINSWD